MDTNYDDIYSMIIGVTIVLLILICFIVLFLFLYRSRQIKHQAEIKRVEDRYHQEILKSQLEISEQTLKNVSEEIHDNVGQVLSFAVLHLSALDFSNREHAEAKVENITSLLKKAVTDLRNLSKTLDYENIEAVGLPALVRFQLELLEKTGLYTIAFTLSGSEKRLSASREIILYRIIQECLNNIVRHAAAGHVEVDMTYKEDELLLEIKDNGKGFEPVAKEETKSPLGAGLKNISKRAGLIKAKLDIERVQPTGTSIKLTIPFIMEPITI
jgi:two-component system NarL family sensor kinase